MLCAQMFSDVKQDVVDCMATKHDTISTQRGLNRQKKSEAWPAMDREDKWHWRGKNKEMRGKRTGGQSQVAAWLSIQFSPNLTRK